MSHLILVSAAALFIGGAAMVGINAKSAAPECCCDVCTCTDCNCGCDGCDCGGACGCCEK